MVRIPQNRPSNFTQRQWFEKQFGDAGKNDDGLLRTVMAGVPGHGRPGDDDHPDGKQLQHSYPARGERVLQALAKGDTDTHRLLDHDDVTQCDEAVPATYVDNEAISHAVTPRVVLTGHPNTNSTLYVSYSEGFRSGFPQDIGVPAGFPAVAPDKLRNYEIGSKGTIADGRLSYDAAVYFMDWIHVQQLLTIQYNGALDLYNRFICIAIKLTFRITSTG